jgi:carbonic anhydrase
MSTQNINISSKNVSGKCDLKCSYNFKYTECNLTAKNNGVSIGLTCDNSNVSPVTYNNNKYSVQNVTIYSPSIHTFNGSSAAGEIVIVHSPVSGGSNLSVSIPISSSSESSTATNLLTEIIQSVSSGAPAQGENTNLNISGFTLQNIVPNKPFYSYTDSTTNWIIFDILNAIPLNSSTLTNLNKIIKPFPIPTPGTQLFYNSSGPNTTKIGEGIYISCKPTGSSKEETAVTYSKNDTTYDFSNILNDPNTKLVFQIIIGCIIFILIFFLLSYVYSFITTSELKLPTISKFSTVNSPV